MNNIETINEYLTILKRIEYKIDNKISLQQTILTILMALIFMFLLNYNEQQLKSIIYRFLH